MNDAIPELPARPDNCGGRRRTSSIRYLVFHYTANDGDSALANARYFAQNRVGASAHYFVDDCGAVQSAADDLIAWAVGGAPWADCAATGGGKLYGQCTNANSLSVELCDTRADGRYGFSEATLENAAALGRRLMKMYGIPPERAVRHFDVNGKHCPGAPGWWGAEDGAWRAFKERLEDDMTGEEIYQKLCAYLEAQPCPDWAKSALAEAVALGVTDGTRPMAPVPRYQAALMAAKAVKLAGEVKK